MQSSLDRLRSEARELDTEQRALLAFELLQSLDSPEPSIRVERAWNNEADRRLAQFDAGDVTTISSRDLHARLDKQRS